MKIPSLRALALSLVLTALGSTSALAQSSGTLNGLAADAQVNLLSGVASVTDATNANTRVGNNSADGRQQGVVHVFEIPSSILSDATRWFDTATYSARLTWSTASTRTADLYGIGYRTTSTVLAADFYLGALDTSATLLKDNFLVPGIPNYTVVSESGVAVADYLNGQLAAARSAGATSAHVFFRTSPDTSVNWQFYQLGMTEAGGANVPTLAYTTFVQPAWVQVPLGGGGYVTGLASDSSGADIYCRTDVGGAFRWVPGAGGNGQWLPIADAIVPSTTPDAHGTMNVVSIAVDPTDRDKLYIAVGRPGSAFSGIYASTDRGANWTLIHSGVAMDGNGTFRNRGERLAVDPNNPDLLWFGSTENGLQKGVKSGSTWTWSTISAADVPFGQVASGGKAGVTFVTCDANSGSTITYAGVHDSVGSTGGIYRSTDSGSTWTKVGGAAVTVPAGGSVAPNGTLYVTANGLVLKMPRGGSLSAITPAAGINYRGVATDRNDATGNTAYVAETNGSAQHNKIWRTTDGGATWAMQHLNLNDNRTIARTEPDGTPALTGYWLGATSALLLNPANSSELWASDFFGVARTANAHQLGGSAVGSQAVWHMLQRNQEEIIPEALKNAPTGPELMLAAADVGGFRYNDVSQRPDGSSGNRFTNPGGANITSLDFSETDHAVWARTWTGNVSAGGSNYYGGGATSRDGGVTWTAFGEIDRRVLSRGPAGWETWDLTTYLATQQAKGMTTLTLVLASGTATNNSAAVLSFDAREATDSALRPHLLLNGATTVTVSEDTMIAGATPTTPNGSSATIGVSYAWGTDANERHTYLKFTLPASPVITSAQLRLHRVAGATGIDFPVGVYACSSTSWSESTLVWTGRPAPYSSGVGKPNNDHRYRTAAGLYLGGGRVSVSSIHPDRMVWMPFGTATVPHYSHDRGVTWTPASGLPANINRLIGKSNPSYLLIQLASDRVNGDFYIAQLSASSGRHYIHRSTDGGVNWSHAGTIPYGTYNVYRVQLVAAPAAGHVWVSDDGVSGTTGGGLWKSTDGAGTWSSRLADIRAVRQVAFGKAPAGSACAYSVYFHGYYNGVRGVYRSDDYGSTWTALPDLPGTVQIESLAGDRQIHGGAFIGTSGRGVFHHQP